MTGTKEKLKNISIKLFGVRITSCISQSAFLSSRRMFARNRHIRNVIRLLGVPFVLLSSRHTVPFVSMDVTTRCNLNCQGCGKYIPTYNEQNLAKDYPLSELYENIDLFCAKIKKCLRFELFGGEPFLYNDLDLIIERLAAEKKIKIIGITSNGTVIPTEKVLLALSKYNVLVNLSNYPKFARKTQKLIDLLEKYAIRYTIAEDTGEWFDWGELKERGYTYEIMKKIFLSCVNHRDHCRTLFQGCLYTCNHSKVGVELGLIPNNAEGEFYDYIDLRKCKNRKEFFRKLKALNNDPSIQKSCYYCLGSNEKRIAKAEQ